MSTIKRLETNELDVEDFRKQLLSAVDGLNSENAALLSILKYTPDGAMSCESYHLGAPEEMGVLCGQSVRQVLQIMFNNPGKVSSDSLDRFGFAFGRSIFNNKNDIIGRAVVSCIEFALKSLGGDDEHKG